MKKSFNFKLKPTDGWTDGRTDGRTGVPCEAEKERALGVRIVGFVRVRALRTEQPESLLYPAQMRLHLQVHAV